MRGATAVLLTALLGGGAILVTGGCATMKPAKPRPVDLGPARKAVDEARQAGAEERAPERLNDALAHLREAEALLARDGSGAAERADRAEWLARLAAVEARCAGSLARRPSPAPEAPKRVADREPADARLRKANEDKRRAEERVAVLQRELELTETEVIRTKARLQGMETKAEASSALAEARVLMRRLEARGRHPSVGRVRELVAKAEQQLAQSNFGAAVFFARRAQDLASGAAARDQP